MSYTEHPEELPEAVQQELERDAKDRLAQVADDECSVCGLSTKPPHIECECHFMQELEPPPAFIFPDSYYQKENKVICDAPVVFETDFKAFEEKVVGPEKVRMRCPRCKKDVEVKTVTEKKDFKGQIKVFLVCSVCTEYIKRVH